MGTRKNGCDDKGNTGANGYLGHVIGQTRTFEADGHINLHSIVHLGGPVIICE